MCVWHCAEKKVSHSAALAYGIALPVEKKGSHATAVRRRERRSWRERVRSKLRRRRSARAREGVLHDFIAWLGSVASVYNEEVGR
eukprot:2336650-Pleurochrysis_carterae.AAC.1